MDFRKVVGGILLIVLAFYALLLTITVHIAFEWSGGYLAVLISGISFVAGIRMITEGLK